MYFVYSALLALVLLLASPYWFFEMWRHGKYRHGFLERLGFVPERILDSRRRSIWIHAVSVGEVLAVSELVKRIQSQFEEHHIVVSTTTDTGQKLAAARFGQENVFYLPFDFKYCVSRYLSALRPELIVIAETEFWPNLLRTAKRYQAYIAVINARISDRSFSGYRRWLWFFTRILQHVDLLLAQTQTDAERLRKIGAPPGRISVSGNLKFDVQPPFIPAIVGQLKSALRSSDARPVLVCGSTVDGEESLLLETFSDVLEAYPAAVMLLAPRHPERFEQVANLLEQAKLEFWKRSEWNGEPLSGHILLIDSIGELASLYNLADLAFVVGSLVPRGGHSILEPAQYGVATLVGPHTENFRDIVELFRSQGAVRVVAPADLTGGVLELLGNERERQALGSRALEVLQSQRGATQFTFEKLRALVNEGVHEAHHA